VLRLAERLAWRRADHIVTVHEGYRRQILDTGVQSSKVSIVLNAPDPTVCYPALRVPPPAFALKIAFHGTISRRTGALLAIEAMPMVLKTRPEARLRLIGAGDGLTEAQDLIESLGLNDSVDLTPEFLPLPDALAEIADAHIGLAPNEPSEFTNNILPVKLLEYSILGIPTIVTRLPLVAEYARDGEVYFLDTAKPENLAEAIIEMTRSVDELKSMSKRARTLAARHSWERYKGALIDALHTSR